MCWVLWTSLPTTTLEQLAYVGHCYELRWSIEDLFRLLKSSYHILDSRLTDAGKVARYLVVITVAAMVVLRLKSQLGLPAKGVLDEQQYLQVKAAMMEPDNPGLGLDLRLFAFLAKHGGWLGRKRDPIGPTILMRGILHLLGALDTVAHYGSLIEEALQDPDLLRRLFCV